LNVNPDDITVSNNEREQRYEARVDGQLALIAYERRGDRIVLIHTEVPEELEGHGVAAKMARVALEDARDRRLTVVPSCPYIASYIQRHPEYRDLIAAG